jgi:tetratricopeptide (TPR) repeat protein
MATGKSKSSSFLGTFAVVLLAIAALFVVDSFLAKTERSESDAEAARLFQEGQRLRQEGRSEDAVHQFQAALSIARGNRDYHIALAGALSEAGKLINAESSLSDLLQQNSTDGEANLLMARVLVKQGRIPEAVSYYHRAIYGQWKQDAAGNRARTRFELVDLLARQNSKEDLLAELLPLQEEAPHDPDQQKDTQKRIGRLFLAAGSPARAAEVFRDVLQRSGDDPQARVGLAEAEFAQGNYRAAESDYLAAARLKPDDDADRKRAKVSRQVLELDPMQRGIGPAERYRRSAKLLEMALEAAARCGGSAPQPSQDQASQELTASAKKALNRHVSPSAQNDAFEDNLDMAEKLWQWRNKECAQPAPEADEPLALVLVKIAQ